MSCGCYNYSVEDAKKEFLQKMGINTTGLTEQQINSAVKIYALSVDFFKTELSKLQLEQPELANPSFELFRRIFNKILSKKIGKVIPFVLQ